MPDTATSRGTASAENLIISSQRVNARGSQSTQRILLTASQRETLAALIPEDRVFQGEAISEDYSHDELGGICSYPDLLIKAKSTQEISSLMRFCDQQRIPVVIRGSGTGLVGSSVAICGGLMIDMSLMNQIIELDKDNMTVTAEPGVLLMELAEYVEGRGCFYPPDPGEKSATIGGNISTNAGGMRAVKYGVTRDYVRGLTVVLPGGDVLELGGKTAKNSSGYALKDLIIGSEGTLAVITQVILKVLPLPAVRVSLLIPFPEFEKALAVVPAILSSKVLPTAVEFMERETILFAEDFLGKRFPDSSAPVYLLLTFDGSDQSSVERDYCQTADLCLERGALDAYIIDTEERHQSVWSARGAFLEAIKASTTQMDECDVVVPRSKIAEFIRFGHETAARMGLRIPGFGHAGDGNLHLYICRDQLDEKRWQEKLAKTFDALYEKAAQLDGQVSGEHGIGYAKIPYLASQAGDTHMQLMKGIKAVFDPHNILNPGKIC